MQTDYLAAANFHGTGGNMISPAVTQWLNDWDETLIKRYRAYRSFQMRDTCKHRYGELSLSVQLFDSQNLWHHCACRTREFEFFLVIEFWYLATAKRDKLWRKGDRPSSAPYSMSLKNTGLENCSSMHHQQNVIGCHCWTNNGCSHGNIKLFIYLR